MSTPTLKALFTRALELTAREVTRVYGYVPVSTLTPVMPLSVRKQNAVYTGLLFINVKQTSDNPYLNDDDVAKYRFVREHVASPTSASFATFAYNCCIASNTPRMEALKVFFVAYAYDMAAMSARKNESQFMYNWLEDNRIFNRLQLESVLDSMRLALVNEAA